MKRIKGAYEAIKLRYLLFIFAGATLVALPLRVYQLLAFVDTATGFYTEDNATIYLLSAILLLVVGAFLALSFISKEVPSPDLPVQKNLLLGITSSVLAVSLIVDAFSILFKIIPPRSAASAFFEVFRTSVSEAGGAFVIFQFLFAVLACIYFVVYAVSNLTGKGHYKEFKLLALTPLCWAITRLVIKLMSAISFTSVSELLYEIFMLVFLMLFFLTFARVSSGVFTEDSMWGIYGYGLSASIFGAIITIPRIVVLVFGRETVEGNPFNFSDLACLIFMVSTVFASLGVGYKVKLSVYKEPEESNGNYEEEEIVATNAGMPKRTDDSLPAINSRPQEEPAGIAITAKSVPETDTIDELVEESGDGFSYISENPLVNKKDDANECKDIYSSSTVAESSAVTPAAVVATTPTGEVKRGRGRPRKNPLPEEITPAPAPAQTAPTAEAPVAEVKRGRGRPRKNPLPEETVPAPVATAEVVAEVTAEQPVEEVKRGRGRPRKNPVPDPVPPEEKRGRGRPKKVLTPEQIAEMEAIAAAKQAEKERKAEERRLAEEAKRAEMARKAEERRLAQEAKKAEAERKAEERRLAQEARRAEAARLAEEKRLAQEAKRAEMARIAEEKRLAEEARKAEEARLAEEARKAEEARRLEEERKRAEEERIRLEEERKRAEEERKAELIRKAEEARRLEEARIAEEARKAEEARRAEEARLALEAQRKIEEARRRAQEERRLEEERKAELARRAEEARKASRPQVNAEVIDIDEASSMMKKPAPPPMVSPKRESKSHTAALEAEKRYESQRRQYKVDEDDEYEIYEEYLAFDDNEQEPEVAPADFGRLSYMGLYDDSEDDDNFVFSAAEEEKEDDGEFNYGVKVVRKRRRQRTPEKAPVKEIVLTDDGNESSNSIDGNAMLSLAEMKKRNNNS